jgi:hypothetical protein
MGMSECFYERAQEQLVCVDRAVVEGIQLAIHIGGFGA